MPTIRELRVDRTVYAIASLQDKSDEIAYWAAKTPEERLETLEIMRQIIYGYDPSTERLQRVFDITQRS
jgi:hypothetical protein